MFTQPFVKFFIAMVTLAVFLRVCLFLLQFTDIFENMAIRRPNLINTLPAKSLERVARGEIPACVRGNACLACKTMQAITLFSYRVHHNLHRSHHKDRQYRSRGSSLESPERHHHSHRDGSHGCDRCCRHRSMEQSFPLRRRTTPVELIHSGQRQTRGLTQLGRDLDQLPSHSLPAAG